MPKSQQKGCGAEIRQRRTEKDFTLEDVSTEVGCTIDHLSKVERGLRPPSRKLCLRLSDVLDMDKDEVLGAYGHVAPDVIDIIAADPALADEVREMSPSS